ncbi:MAG: cell division protein FtsX [Bacteroidia bacterium]|nr:cell division protein FtsX [Bacteroidia bacterium]
MSDEIGMLARKPLQSSYVSSIISMALVLFLLGILGVLLMQANAIANYIKQNYQVTLVLADSLPASATDSLQQLLAHEPMVNAYQYVSKDEAAVKLQSELGEDFVSFLGYNPLHAAIDVTFKAQYVDDSLLTRIQQWVSSNPAVMEVYYQKSLIEKINSNLKSITWFLLGFSTILLIVALFLINNTIRVNLYSKRMLIRSMQLVGATRGFIMKPFLINALLHGLISGVIAAIMVYGTIYLTQLYVLQLTIEIQIFMWGILFCGLITTGVLISFISTFFAVGKWLGKRSYELF